MDYYSVSWPGSEQNYSKSWTDLFWTMGQMKEKKTIQSPWLNSKFGLMDAHEHPSWFLGCNTLSKLVLVLDQLYGTRSNGHQYNSWKYPQVGGYWDKSCSAVTQLKEGLNRILCLIPYNVINQAVWECIMPEWLEAIRTEVPDNQLKEFREVLRYVDICRNHFIITYADCWGY